MMIWITNSRYRIGLVYLLIAANAALVGCNNEAEIVRQARRKQKQQLANEAATVDHLNEAAGYISRMVELDPQAATRQINYHLNAWLEASPPKVDRQLSPLAAQRKQLFPDEFDAVRPDSDTFLPGDIAYFRRCYLLSRIANWAGDRPLHDPLLAAWFADADSGLDAKQVQTLEKASRLFDWTLRNIQLQPMQFPANPPRVGPNELPAGLIVDGPGYRQTLEECLWRGTGDGLQRSRVFMALCQQAGIDCCMLAIKQPDRENVVPWLVGVRSEQQIFLFDAMLGTYVPGPGQQGIATLADAKSDPSVLRRMKIAGLFDYPVDPSWLKKVVAFVDVPSEAFCWRMQALQRGLTGDARMRLSYDPETFESLKALDSIDDVEAWSIDALARRYQFAMQRAMADDLKVLIDQQMRWGMLAPNFPLAKARWNHLTGAFDGGEQDGARIQYMNLRIPDTDIENLPYDVNLQVQLNARRQPGQPQEAYDQQLRIIQAQYRQAKQAATFWLALIQFEDSRYENAATWQQKRVLGRDIQSPWASSARYNVARALEHLDRDKEAIEYYKTQRDPQEHGNRIRARLLSREADE
ncbi:hypothetical protein Poly24_19070 [Rosistilla carotiformis]|uniref:Transglutaminase-like superfamily protein n=1 Tax=Rosistilla carotiformis TaxID=2528017 RepID=A0A518JRP2_9BACT|nr:hypothetical protein [Rosistilla carotiformis]QDV68198.1 hypothetical protein Poly24_19070 [Rosistilla carotiformis]